MNKVNFGLQEKFISIGNVTKPLSHAFRSASSSYEALEKFVELLRNLLSCSFTLLLCCFLHFIRKSLHMSQVAHQARAYHSFCSMKRLGIFLLLPGWDASPLQGYPQHWGYHYSFVHLGGDLFLTQERNTMSPTRAQAWTVRSGYELTNHEGTAPQADQLQCALFLEHFLNE